MSSLIDSPPLPWYRQGWPWFLISLPLVSVVLGIGMLVLAFGSNHALVVDDYYTEGKTINQRIERDRQAALLGLSARFGRQAGALVVNLHAASRPLHASRQAPATHSADGSAASGFVAPEILELRWIHVTQAERDGKAVLRHAGGGRYVAADTQLPVDGIWHIHLQPPGDARWRLVSARVDPTGLAELTLQARPLSDFTLSAKP